MSAAASAPDGETVALTDDGVLALHASDGAMALCADWVPIGRQAAAPSAARATIIARLAAADERTASGAAPTFTLGNVSVAVAADEARLSGRATGGVSLGALAARVALPGGDTDADALARRSALTACAALLLGRLGRALVHAGAVVHPEREAAWLLVGDTHAGKSTTVANLARAGWGVLADDTVSLSADEAGRVFVEGWPRVMHLDAGWGGAAPAGTRVARDPREVLGRPPRRAPAALGGVLFPFVDAVSATRGLPRSGADALAMLIRQSPWLFADAAAAPAVLRLLREAASSPAAALSLGADTFADPPALDRAVREVTA